MKKVISVLSVILVFVLLFAFLNLLLSPKYAVEFIEGSMIAEWYFSSRDHDVIFIGDCDVYSSFIPSLMYEQEGFTSFIRGTPHQFVWQSYYILRETLRHETPSVVVFSVHALRYDRRHGDVRDMHSRTPMRNVEAYNRLTIDNMRWSRDRIDIIRASMTEGESFLSYVFPILRYNSRFDSLTREDFRYLFSRRSHTDNGFLPNENIQPLGALPARRIHANYDFYAENMYYLQRMADLCYERGIDFVLIMPPRMFPHWYDEFEAQIREFAAQPGVSYYNFLDSLDTIGLDFSVDTHNGGLNLNVTGAEKLSRYFASILMENYLSN
ncbi:MAG: SGNH/GDSL hydrolase family protein [Oscillospiraceae bacterium]|nr:SGNH/GDSL hydrolase family protein [Oscillospiraceae bacterium]